MDLSVLDTSEVDHAGELLGPRPPSSMDLSASAVTVSIPGTSRSRAVTSRTQCRHRMPPTISPIVRTRVSPSGACFVPACGRPLSGGCPLAGEKDDVPAGCVRMRTRNHAGTAARLGGHVATETGQAEDRRPVEPFGIGSITAPLNIEREGTHVFHRTRRGKDRPPALALSRRAIRGDHGHVDHRRCLRGVVRHHGVSSRAPLTESCRTLASSEHPNPLEKNHVPSHS